MEIEYKELLPQPDVYLNLFESTGWNEVYEASKEELIEAIQSSWYCLSAYADGVLVGFGRIVSDGVLYAVVYDLIVLPDYQKQGIGKEILKRLSSKCMSSGIRDLQLFSAKGTQKFYIKNGFEVRQPDAPGMRLNKTKAEQE